MSRPLPALAHCHRLERQSTAGPPSRKASETWDGDRALICDVLAYLHLDPDESPDSLHSVAVALLYAASEGGTADAVPLLLAHWHPREELARGAREREWHDELGWDDPPEVGI